MRRPRQRRDCPHADHPKLIFFGRLDEPRKGLDVLLAVPVMPIIRREVLQYEIVVAGRAPGSCPTGAATPARSHEETKSHCSAPADVFVAPTAPGRASASWFLKRWRAGAGSGLRASVVRRPDRVIP